MGHFAEAKMALDFLLGTNPVGAFKSYVSNYDYRISVVRYFGTGGEQADYSGQPSPNVETDGWGMVLWSARQYVEASGDAAWLTSPTKLGPNAYDALKQGVAGAIEANLEPSGIMKADSGIWEVHDQNKRHFAYTTMSAARGICDMAVLAQKANDGGSVGHYQQLAAKIKTGIGAAFTDQQGAIGGSVEGIANNKYYDGSVAELFDWNILDDWKGNTAQATLRMFQNLRVGSGGFKRNNDALSDYDNNEWILVDLRISNALRRSGSNSDADAYVAQIVAKAAANFFLLPELYDAVSATPGAYTGSIPMVGYGAGAYIITMLDRSGKSEPNDCADGNGKTLPPLSCTGISTNPGGPPGGPGGPGGASSGGPGGNGAPDAAQVPYTPACLCNLHTLTSATPWGLALLPIALLVRRRRR
jgi:GH15 family glucan-1,4-alpha-glucosidase